MDNQKSKDLTLKEKIEENLLLIVLIIIIIISLVVLAIPSEWLTKAADFFQENFRWLYNFT